MPKLTTAQIKELSKRSYLISNLNLKCDDRKITLIEVRNKSRVRTMLYVDDCFSLQWCFHPNDHEESKFYRKAIRYRKKSPRSKKKEKVDLGMRKVDFASVGQALRHLNKVCDSVELWTEPDAINVDSATRNHITALVDDVLGGSHE